MERREFQKQINSSWKLFDKDLNLGRSMICESPLTTDDEVVSVSIDPSSSYEKIYKIGLKRSSYNFILSDYAYFQFSLESKEAWRLAYFPNPWISGVHDAQEALSLWADLEASGVIDTEETLQLISELPYENPIPQIRFENSPNQYKEIIHPSAHFHIGRHSENRWPCILTLGPLAFCMLIARLYYPDKWKIRSSYEDDSISDCLDKSFSRAIEQSNVVRNFSSVEQKHLHFGRNLVQLQDQPIGIKEKGKNKHKKDSRK